MTGQQYHSGLRQAEMIMALSLATDLGTGHPMEWAASSAVLSVRLGEKLGLSEQRLREVYYISLLAYIGCTAATDTRVELFGENPGIGGSQYAFMDPTQPRQMLGWMFRYAGANRPLPQRIQAVAKIPSTMPTLLQAHCEVAQQFAERMGFEQSIVDSIWQVYERWDGMGMPRHLKGEQLTPSVRIVQLAQDVESYRRAGRANEVEAVVRERAGKAYDPAVAEAFCRHAAELLTGLDDEMGWEAALAAEPGEHVYLSEDELDEVALVLADFTDLLSSYELCHSREVAGLAMEAARHFGLPDADLKTVQRIGWLHDLGKIGVPPGIWCKPSSLTQSEWERVRLHPYYTERILSRPAILAELGSVAALHHERQDGSGYHHGLRANSIPPAARLLAAANFYQAKIEARPYREALSPEAGADKLRQEVRAGRLDSDAVKAVLTAAGHHSAPVRRDRIAGLTEREIEVLRLMTRSLTKRQMAQHLSVSEKTIDSHATHIYEKIHVSTRAAAALFAVQHDLIGNANESL